MVGSNPCGCWCSPRLDTTENAEREVNVVLVVAVWAETPFFSRLRLAAGRNEKNFENTVLSDMMADSIQLLLEVQAGSSRYHWSL